MSGLDSIALAVAHLEEQQQKQQRLPTTKEEEQNASTGGDQKLKIPAPQSFGSTARVVSTESIAIYGDKLTKQSTVPDATPSPNNESFMDDVLSNPSAWLHSFSRTQSAVASPPPADEVITHVQQDDVLCGRGGETNHHQGNIQYRNLVKAFQPLYIASKRRDKPRLAQCIVYTVRQSGGRFLKRTDPRSNTWTDVGNIKAREKTSQALREGAPELRGNEGSKHAQRVDSPTTSSPVAAANIFMPATPPMIIPAPIAAASSHTVTPQHTMIPHHVALHHAASLTPLQQAMSRTLMAHTHHHYHAPDIPVVSPRFSPPLDHSTRKRPSFIATVSDRDSDRSSSPTERGPRLKRLKLRMAQNS